MTNRTSRRIVPSQIITFSLLFGTTMLSTIVTASGCVERTVTIHTEPEEATVFLNDQEVGKSPVKGLFMGWADSDIIFRKEGYQTLKTHRRINAPWYQWPFIDFFAECLVPFTIHDNHVLEVFVLEPRQSVDKETLLESAEEPRGRTLGETPSNY